MKRNFNEDFKKDFMRMQVGEDWNILKEKYDVSKYIWDDEMKKHFEKLLGKYSSHEDFRKKETDTM